MEQWFIDHSIAPLWALIWHFGIIGVVLGCSLAWAAVAPVLKKTALWVALGSGIILVTASVYTELGARYVQAKWDAANAVDLRKAEQARTDAEASVPALVPGAPAPRLPYDKYDRDLRK